MIQIDREDKSLYIEESHYIPGGAYVAVADGRRQAIIHIPAEDRLGVAEAVAPEGVLVAKLPEPGQNGPDVEYFITEYPSLRVLEQREEISLATLSTIREAKRRLEEARDQAQLNLIRFALQEVSDDTNLVTQAEALYDKGIRVNA